MSLVLCLAVAVAGWAVELAHPVFFANEPLVLWTSDLSAAPELFFCGRPWPAAWRRIPEGDRVRWEADLCGAPLGVWTVCAGSMCFAFLRVEGGASLVEVRGAPAGAQVVLDETRTHAVASDGATFFVTQPGLHRLEIKHLCTAVTKHLRLRAGERYVVQLSDLLKLETSASEVLPGHRLRLVFHVRSALPLPFLQVQADLPPGWRVVEDQELLWPVPADALVTRGIVVEVSKDAAPGTHRVSLRWHGQEARLSVQVRRSLSPLTVVGHWDAAGGRLALDAPFALSFERALWAASLLGQPIPYTTEIMTPELLRRILEIWASGEAR